MGVPPDHLASGAIDRKGLLLAVADGMGGEVAGKRASSLAVKQLFEIYYGDDEIDILMSLLGAARRAAEAVHRDALTDPSARGMGTTLTAAVVRGVDLVVVHVGDSRAYLVRDGTIEQITNDHTWVAEAVRRGTLTPEQGRNHPRRNVLTRSIGSEVEPRLDFNRKELRATDKLVLCSDGLTGHVRDEEIRDVVDSLHPEEAVERLVDLANSRGGKDNISVVIYCRSAPARQTPAPSRDGDTTLAETIVTAGAAQDATLVGKSRTVIENVASRLPAEVERRKISITFLVLLGLVILLSAVPWLFSEGPAEVPPPIVPSPQVTASPTAEATDGTQDVAGDEATPVENTAVAPEGPARPTLATPRPDVAVSETSGVLERAEATVATGATPGSETVPSGSAPTAPP